MCLVAEPNIEKGEPLPVDLEQDRDAEERLAKLEGKITNRGVAVPWKEIHFVNPEEFKAKMVHELPKLALFTEEVLDLSGKLPLGVKISDQSLELPLMKDRSGPGYGVILAADPVRYVSTRLSTSPFDRMLHFWITDDEANQLWSEISMFETELNNGDERAAPRYPMLSKVAGAKYGGLVVLPSEVTSIALESATLQERTENGTLKLALERISSVCMSAESYHLGIYVPGE
jgi:hypothetical protein